MRHFIAEPTKPQIRTFLQPISINTKKQRNGERCAHTASRKTDQNPRGQRQTVHGSIPTPYLYYLYLTNSSTSILRCFFVLIVFRASNIVANETPALSLR